MSEQQERHLKGHELLTYRKDYLRVAAEVQRWIRITEPSTSAMYRQIGRMLEGLRFDELQIARMLEMDKFSAQLHLATLVQAQWLDVIEQTKSAAPVLQNVGAIHYSWLRGFGAMEAILPQVQAMAALAIGNTIYRQTLTERLFADLDLAAMGSAMHAIHPHIGRMVGIVADVRESYWEMAGGIESLPDLTRLPAYAMPGATREVFVGGHVLSTVSYRWDPEPDRDNAEIELVAEIEQETSVSVPLLRSFDPALASTYQGARQAAQSQNPDRARHVLTSLRELWYHLLRGLAPDQEVLAWALGKDDNLIDYKGRPTYRARVLYVCRGLSHGTMSDFVVKDTTALVALIGFLNRLHKLDSGLSDTELWALVLRTDSWLLYILQIAGVGEA